MSIHAAALAAALLLGGAAGAEGKKPLKVFILAGQSNMDGQANVATIDFLGEDPDPARAALLKTFKPDGKSLVTREDVWVASGEVYGDLRPGHGGRKDRGRLGKNIGPEYAFGYSMGEALEEQVLLIKYGPGGKSLQVDFRPPGAGLPAGRKAEEVGAEYRALVAHVRDVLDHLPERFPGYDPAAGREIAGLVWFQGYNDLFDEQGRKDYGKNLACLIDDLRREFGAPEMKVVVGVMGVNGPRNEIGKQKEVRDGQRSVNGIARFQGNVKAIETAHLLHPKVLELKCAGWLYPERDLKKDPLTAEEKALLARATSSQGYHYHGEGRFFILLGKAMAEAMLELLGRKAAAAPATPAHLEGALAAGGLAGYLGTLSDRLDRRVPADPGAITAEGLAAVIGDPAAAGDLARHRLLSKAGIAPAEAFLRSGEDRREFLAGLLGDPAALELALEGLTPIGIAARDEDRYGLPAGALEIWRRIAADDPEARQGLFLRLAIAAALSPPGSGNRGAGMATTAADPVARYRHFKAAWLGKELYPSFGTLTVWELRQVVSSCASDEDLAWARRMLAAWRPDLPRGGLVVNSTSEVWRRTSPFPYTDYRSVMAGGGKCGPRSSWSVMICQAFGIPAIGVSQPGHACVAYKALDPAQEPQPGSAWKVAYGRGWQFSRLEGLTGPDFLAGIDERSRASSFSRAERLRWLAAALPPGPRAEAVLAAARKVRLEAPPPSPPDPAASAKADEADRDGPPERPAAGVPAGTGEPLRVGAGGVRFDASGFSAVSEGVLVLDSRGGGRQVNFQKNLERSWVEYRLEVAEAGARGLVLQVAAPNLDQVLEVCCGGGEAVKVAVPDTTGLWGTTAEATIRLERGIQTLRISAPYQRGVAVRRLELTARKE